MVHERVVAVAGDGAPHAQVAAVVARPPPLVFVAVPVAHVDVHQPRGQVRAAVQPVGGAVFQVVQELRPSPSPCPRRRRRGRPSALRASGRRSSRQRVALPAPPRCAESSALRRVLVFLGDRSRPRAPRCGPRRPAKRWRQVAQRRAVRHHHHAAARACSTPAASSSGAARRGRAGVRGAHLVLHDPLDERALELGAQPLGNVLVDGAKDVAPAVRAQQVQRVGGEVAARAQGREAARRRCRGPSPPRARDASTGGASCRPTASGCSAAGPVLRAPPPPSPNPARAPVTRERPRRGGEQQENTKGSRHMLIS